MPYIFMKMKGDGWIHEQWIKEDEDDEDD